MTTLVGFDRTVPKGRWTRFWRRVGGRRVLMAGERLAGAPVCRVTVRTYGGTPWQELADALEPGAPAVFEKHTVLPVGFPVPPTDGEPLRRRLLLNGALWVLETAAQRDDPGEVALFDRGARYTALVPRLMQSCRALTVVTDDAETYHRLGERLFGTLGVAPMVTDRADGMGACRAVLAPEGVAGFGALEKPKLLFSPDAGEGLTLTAQDVLTPFSDDLLARFDAFELLTALRGERLFRDVGGIVPRTMTEGSRRVGLSELAGRFDS